MSDNALSAANIERNLPRYRVGAEVGRGGMSIVYLAEDLGPLRRKRVALKVLEPLLANDGRFRQRFEAEAQLVANLVHPHVIPIYDFGEAGGLLYLAMHYVEGSDLWQVLGRHGPLQPAQAARVFTQVAGALDAAHRQGLIHRDVKPGNVLIERPGGSDEHAYLSDFGITKNIASGESLTATGQFVGTVDYIAPEQIDGHLPLDRRADVYSLGAMVFECLSGEVPYPRDTDMQKLFAHLQDEPPSLRHVRPDLGPAVDGVVHRAMAKDRDDRYATCGELAADLEEALSSVSRRGSGSVAPAPPPPSGSVAPAPPPPSGSVAPAPPPPSAGAPRRGGRGVVAVGLVVAAAVAVVLAWAALSGNGGSPSPRDVVVDGT
ncbi:MAG TPA: serine/threonine-protein kinase, partial [Acidimicrobiales bacterium]|nr:serine/threonine-protein kinase [Acidimicrobiales bacterium]